MRARSYDRTIAGLTRDFGRLLQERDRLNIKLVELLAAVRALSSLSGEEGPREQYVRDMAERIWQPRPNLTAAIEGLLESAGTEMTPLQIKQALLQRGYDLRKYSFAMGAIHGSLKALVKEGLVAREVLKDESKVYRRRTSGSCHMSDKKYYVK